MAHGLLQLAKPKPTAAVVLLHAQHDVAYGASRASVYVPGGHKAQAPPALPKLPAPHCEGNGTVKL